MMATILLVEDAPDIGTYEAKILEAEGHVVIRCNGAPSPLAACPMMRYGRCPLPDGADLIVFSCSLLMPVGHRTYRGSELLRAYREHERYGRLPMLVVWVGVPPDVQGRGPMMLIEKFSEPRKVIDAVHRLIRPGPTRSLVSAGLRYQEGVAT
jgi:CheY-like chemotaxis protein